MKKIAGFKLKIAEPGTYIEDTRNLKTNYIGSMSIMTHETINHNNKEKLEADCYGYNIETGIAVFMFDKPKHELELPERFIQTAKGINKESNCELIFEE